LIKDKEQSVKKILEFLGDFLPKISFIGVITFLTVIPIKINLPKIVIKNERINKIMPKIKKF